MPGIIGLERLPFAPSQNYKGQVHVGLKVQTKLKFIFKLWSISLNIIEILNHFH
jgi:hypothetical protein